MVFFTNRSLPISQQQNLDIANKFKFELSYDLIKQKYFKRINSKKNNGEIKKLSRFFVDFFIIFHYYESDQSIATHLLIT